LTKEVDEPYQPLSRSKRDLNSARASAYLPSFLSVVATLYCARYHGRRAWCFQMDLLFAERAAFKTPLSDT
jgi:hypothetical protein